MASCTSEDVLKMLFWYNFAPKLLQDEETTPSNQFFTHQWNSPNVFGEEFDHDDPRPYTIGELVWIKPGGTRCTTQWKKGTVTRILSNVKVEVYGIARRVNDIAKINVIDRSSDEDCDDELQMIRTNRQRQPPPPIGFKIMFKRLVDNTTSATSGLD